MNSSIWPIDGILKAITTPNQIEPRNDVNEGLLHIPQTPRLELHHQIQFNVKFVCKQLNGFNYCYFNAIDPQPPPFTTF